MEGGKGRERGSKKEGGGVGKEGGREEGREGGKEIVRGRERGREKERKRAEGGELTFSLLLPPQLLLHGLPLLKLLAVGGGEEHLLVPKGLRLGLNLLLHPSLLHNLLLQLAPLGSTLEGVDVLGLRREGGGREGGRE